jgi:hypothetical protein
MFSEKGLSKSKLMDWPKVILVHRSINWLMDKDRAVLLSIVLAYYSYFYASMYQNSAVFTSSGSIISAIGLLLTLKHNFLAIAQNAQAAVIKHHQIMRFASQGMMEDPEYVNPAIIALKDEYTGVILVLIGGFISGYGGFVPLIVTI